METLFFLASKIFWALAMPANMAVLLLLSGFVVGWLLPRFRRTGIALVIAGGVVLGVFGLLSTGQALLYALETRVPAIPVAALPEKVDGILVLGGAVNTRVSSWTGSPQFNEGADRVMMTEILMHRYPRAKVVFSGGAGLLFPGTMREFDAMKKYIEAVGLYSHNVIYEDSSRNTYENIHNSFRLVSPEKGEVWILVTSAFHMPRSLEIARKLGWDIMAFPVDYRSQGSYRVIPVRLDVLDNLYASNVSIREFTGLLAYRLTGKL